MVNIKTTWNSKSTKWAWFENDENNYKTNKFLSFFKNNIKKILFTVGIGGVAANWVLLYENDQLWPKNNLNHIDINEQCVVSHPENDKLLLNRGPYEDHLFKVDCGNDTKIDWDHIQVFKNEMWKENYFSYNEIFERNKKAIWKNTENVFKALIDTSYREKKLTWYWAEFFRTVIAEDLATFFSNPSTTNFRVKYDTYRNVHPNDLNYFLKKLWNFKMPKDKSGDMTFVFENEWFEDVESFVESLKQESYIADLFGSFENKTTAIAMWVLYLDYLQDNANQRYLSIKEVEKMLFWNNENSGKKLLQLTRDTNNKIEAYNSRYTNQDINSYQFGISAFYGTFMQTASKMLKIINKNYEDINNTNDWLAWKDTIKDFKNTFSNTPYFRDFDTNNLTPELLNIKNPEEEYEKKREVKMYDDKELLIQNFINEIELRKKMNSWKYLIEDLIAISFISVEIKIEILTLISQDPDINIKEIKEEWANEGKTINSLIEEYIETTDPDKAKHIMTLFDNFLKDNFISQNNQAQNFYNKNINLLYYIASMHLWWKWVVTLKQEGFNYVNWVWRTTDKWVETVVKTSNNNINIIIPNKTHSDWKK